LWKVSSQYFRKSMAHSVRAVIAILSAVCIWLAALIQALQFFGLTGGIVPEYSQQDYVNRLRTLDPPTLRTYWIYKRSQLGVDFIIDLLGALGLAGLAYCVIILKRVFKKYKGGASDVPAFMVGCFAIGAIIPALQFLQSLGYTTAADILSQVNGLPDVGLQALHVSYNINRGGTFYLFSMQFICVSIGLILSSVLSFQTGDLPKAHAVIGLIAAFFGVLTFIFELVSFNVGSGTGYALGAFVLLYGIIFLPIWTVWLGAELRKIKAQQVRDKAAALDSDLVADEQRDSVSMDNIK